MMKQLAQTFLLTLLMSMVGAKAFAYDAIVNGIYYNFSEKSAEVTCLYYKDSRNKSAYTGSVVIPETVTYNGTTYSVTSIGSYAFYYCSGLTSVTIPNSVTSIGDDAFKECSGLKNVTIPNSVTSIGSDAFMGCSSLTSVTIPNSVTSLGGGAFEYCSGLTSVTIPNSVTSIGNGTFFRCSNLTSVTIPNSVTSIGRLAFSDCSKLTSVTIPNSVTSIDEKAFEGSGIYKNATDGVFYVDKWVCGYKGSLSGALTLDDNTRGIAAYAFSGCSKLTSVTIPNSVTSIGNYAFQGCI